MPKMHQLRYFIALADTLSFSKAAALCHVTQPTLSAQIKELEERLQVQLVERSRSFVFLTPIGEEIAVRARAIIAQTEDIREIARGTKNEQLSGTLQMGVVQTLGAYVLSLAVPKLRKKYPDLRLSVWEDRIESLPVKLLEGAHDLMLIPSKPQHAELTSMMLMREPFQIVMRYDHPLAHQSSINSSDLNGQTLLSMDRSGDVYNQMHRLCAEVGASFVTDYAGATLDTLRQMVAARMGISLLPALYVRSDVLREKLVVARPLSFDGPSREIHMVWRQSSPRHAKYLDFAKLISECLAPWDAGETGVGN